MRKYSLGFFVLGCTYGCFSNRPIFHGNIEINWVSISFSKYLPFCYHNLGFILLFLSLLITLFLDTLVHLTFADIVLMSLRKGKEWLLLLCHTNVWKWHICRLSIQLIQLPAETEVSCR